MECIPRPLQVGRWPRSTRTSTPHYGSIHLTDLPPASITSPTEQPNPTLPYINASDFSEIKLSPMIEGFHRQPSTRRPTQLLSYHVITVPTQH